MWRVVGVPIEFQEECGTGHTLEVIEISDQKKFYFKNEDEEIIEMEHYEFKERIGPQAVFEPIQNVSFVLVN